MTAFDGCAIGFIFVSLVIGTIRGATREVLSLCAWCGSIASTWMFWPAALHLFRGWISNPMLAGGATIVALFLLFLILFGMINYLLSNLIRDSWMSGMDRALGCLFGIGRGVFLLCVTELSMSVLMHRAQYPHWLKNARCMALLFQGSDVLYTCLPHTARYMIDEQRIKLQSNSSSTTVSAVMNADGRLLPQNPQNIEEIARLQPKRIPLPEGYSKKQRQAMERFLSQDSAKSQEHVAYNIQ